jgi:hypothetical protein
MNQLVPFLASLLRVSDRILSSCLILYPFSDPFIMSHFVPSKNSLRSLHHVPRFVPSLGSLHHVSRFVPYLGSSFRSHTLEAPLGLYLVGLYIPSKTLFLFCLQVSKTLHSLSSGAQSSVFRSELLHLSGLDWDHSHSVGMFTAMMQRIQEALPCRAIPFVFATFFCQHHWFKKVSGWSNRYICTQC